ncbi:MAG: putative DNA binding domain-containing protein [Candidatus Methanoperedens sp.]|uniref:RNA-binding domain-containing protein n=1 Tax=Candidatus Methanoperedens nitratireducens TaxID=1392998 RepID=UPI0012FE992B|nr:RNA-binding domain-containing protein [Candidatus Methanoperedens nitroreducens]MDJ1422527.1 putative DNA binding domain-containing protein [Candidatus Methanoperedens sp.]
MEELEWEDFEVKEAKTSIPKSSFETVSAFSNTNGGWLVFGVSQVDKTFKISGVDNAEKIEQDFTMPRNPIVTKIFRVIKLAENAGSGFDKMFNGWKAYYKDEPVVSGGIDFYKITFPLVKITKASEKTSEKTSEKIILLIRENPAISAKEIAEKIGVSSRAIEMQIANLKQNKIIKRIGPDKGGMWEVMEK